MRPRPRLGEVGQFDLGVGSAEAEDGERLRRGVVLDAVALLDAHEHQPRAQTITVGRRLCRRQQPREVRSDQLDEREVVGLDVGGAVGRHHPHHLPRVEPDHVAGTDQWQRHVGGSGDATRVGEVDGRLERTAQRERAGGIGVRASDAAGHPAPQPRQEAWRAHAAAPACAGTTRLPTNDPEAASASAYDNSAETFSPVTESMAT